MSVQVHLRLRNPIRPKNQLHANMSKNHLKFINMRYIRFFVGQRYGIFFVGQVWGMLFFPNGSGLLRVKNVTLCVVIC